MLLDFNNVFNKIKVYIYYLYMSLTFGSTHMIRHNLKIDGPYLVIKLDTPDSLEIVESLIGSLTGVHCYLKDKKNETIEKGIEDFIRNNRENNNN
jgi:hypothetical protein